MWDMFAISCMHSYVQMYVAAPIPEGITNVGSDPEQDNCHMAVHGACVHSSDGVWVECSDCHNMLKEHNSLAAIVV